MSKSSIEWITRSASRAALLTACLACGLLFRPETGMAELGGPFAKFGGGWRGAGHVVNTDGSKERITCRATYAISRDGAGLSQALICASDSYRIDISSYAVADGHRVQGHWQESTHQVQGSLTGQIVDGDFEGTLAGLTFTAGISLRATGRRQVVTISPQGGGVAEADIVLSHDN
jgi:hypothetical protein